MPIEFNRVRFDFTNSNVLVVGGSSGIGNGVAQEFRSAGAAVHVWGKRPRADDYVGEEGSDLTGLRYSAVDVTDLGAITAYQPPFDRLDVLVLSQGAVLYSRKEYEMEGFAQVIAVNLNSLMACAMKFWPHLKAARGSVIVISSTGAFRATKGNPAYAASKAGTLGLVRSLAEAWAPAGVRVNAVAPGLIDSRMTKVTTQNPDRLRRALEEIPAGRLGQSHDIAGAALFLASSAADYIVGQTLVVDGGSLLS